MIRCNICGHESEKKLRCFECDTGFCETHQAQYMNHKCVIELIKKMKKYSAILARRMGGGS